jgi:hypothetical protein
MVSIFPVSLRPDLHLPSQVDHLRRLASFASSGRHHVATDAESADVVLFLDLHYLDWRLHPLTSHPLRQRYPEKSLVFCDVDRPWCALPGMYVNMPARTFEWRWQRPWLYLGTAAPVEATPPQEADLLFSFRGGRTHRCRKDVLRLRHGRAIVEASSGFLFHDSRSTAFVEQQRRFLDLLKRSKFVLCPRGHGTSSIRLLETLASGRVPVIISNAWVPPSEPDWASFSLRVPEGRIDDVPQILEDRESAFETMAHKASEAYQRFFAPPVAFDNLVSLAAGLTREALLPAFPPNGLHGRRWARLWLAERSANQRHRLSPRRAPAREPPSDSGVSNGFDAP